jgi:transcriptional regulator with XRE-family HTH domain
MRSVKMHTKPQDVGRGERIRVNRRLKEISQFEISKRTGLSMATISLVERGRRCRPETLEVIERALGLDDDPEGGGDE